VHCHRVLLRFRPLLLGRRGSRGGVGRRHRHRGNRRVFRVGERRVRDKQLAAHARELDSTRLITAALLVRSEGDTKIVDDPLGNVLDVLGTNEYVGWYEKSPEEIGKTSWDIRYNKPVIMSEFGGGAKAGLHGTDQTRWSEEFQASIYRNQIAMLNKIPQLRGTTPWLLMDFRSPVRLLPGIQDGFNRKGLVSTDGKKKMAFFVLQKAYRENALGKPE